MKRKIQTLTFILLLLVSQFAVFTIMPNAHAGSGTFYVGGSEDDAYERGDGGFYTTTTLAPIRSRTDPSTLLYQCPGFRFPNVNIPKGSTIISANFSFYLYSATYDDVNTKIYGNDVDNAQNFVDNANIINVANRPRTAANVSWVGDSIGTGWKTKNGLEGIIQEIVDRDGWQSGNAICLLFIANTDANKICQGYSYDQGSEYAAYLQIVWEAGDTLSPTYSDVGTNTTIANQPCLFHAKWTDDVNLSHYIFGTNNTGAWQNDTAVAFSSNPDWSNITKQLNSTIGIRIEWQIWANDTANNWNTTGIQFLITQQYFGYTYSYENFDYVDQTSNVDGVADIGTHSNFTALKATDNILDTLTETDMGNGGTGSFGNDAGTSTYNLYGNEMAGSWYTCNSQNEATLQTITWYGKANSGTANVKAVIVFRGNLTILAVSQPVAVSTTAQTWTNTFSTPPKIYASVEYVLMVIPDAWIILSYNTVSSKSYADSSNSYTTPTNPTDATSGDKDFRIMANYKNPNFGLELEVQFTNIDWEYSTRVLCIKTGSFDAETLSVQRWTGASWTNLYSLSASTWNNISIYNFLSSVNFTIRFIDATRTTDYVKNSWGIDSVLIHTHEHVGYTEKRAGYDVTFFAYWKVPNKSGYIFSWFNGSQTRFVNDTWVGFGGSSWSNVEKTLPTPEIFLQFRFYVNSTDGWVKTRILTFETITTFYYSDFGVNTTLSNNNADFHIFFNDTKYNLDDAFFQWDYPDGVYTSWETVWTNKGTQTSWANITKMLPDGLGITIFYRFKVNNTEGHEHILTNELTTTWEVDRYPRYDPATLWVTTARPNAYADFCSNWTSPEGLAGYIFSWNDGTGWVNDTYTTIDGSPTVAWINVTKQLPNVHRRVTIWTVYVKDGANNWEKLTNQIHVVTDSEIIEPYNSTVDWARWQARLSAQKKIFWWGDRFWAFYVKNVTGNVGDWGFRTSVDGETWSSFTKLCTGWAWNAYYDVVFNSTGFIHIGFIPTLVDVKYFAGQMQTDGTITGLTSIQTIYTAQKIYKEQTPDFPYYKYLYVDDVFITLDANGYPIITFPERHAVCHNATWVIWDFYGKCLKSSSKTGTWAMASGFPLNVDRSYLFGYDYSIMNYPYSPPVPWTISVTLSGTTFFVVGWFKASERYMQINPTLKTTLKICRLSGTTVTAPVQLSQDNLWQRVFAGFTVIPLPDNRIAYAYITSERNIRIGIWYNSTYTREEIEIWHDVYYETENWSVDTASPVLLYDGLTDSLLIFGASVNRVDEIVMKILDLVSGSWSAEIVIANEKENGMASHCSIISCWATNEGIIPIMYSANPSNITLRLFWVNSTKLLQPPFYSNIGAIINYVLQQVVFHTYWITDSTLDKADFYWNMTGSLIYNGTYTFDEYTAEAWSNFTRSYDYGSYNIAWKIVGYDDYGNINGTDVQMKGWVDDLRTATQTMTVQSTIGRLIDISRFVSQSINYLAQAIGSVTHEYFADVFLSITTLLQNIILIDLTRIATQDFTVNTSVARLAEIFRMATQPITSAFMANRLIEIARQVDQTLIFSFVTTRIFEATRTIMQTFSFQFIASRLGELAKTVSQTLSFSSSITRQIDVTRLAIQILIIDFQASRLIEIIRYTGLSFGLSIVSESVFSIARLATMTLTTAWNGIRQIDVTRSVTQLLGFMFTTSRLAEFFRESLQQITFLSNVNRTFETVRNLLLQLTMVFSSSRTAEYFRETAQILTLGLIGERSIEITRTVTQTFLFSTSVSTVQQYLMYVSLTISTVWNGIRQIDIQRVATQSIILGFYATRLIDIQRVATQAITSAFASIRQIDVTRLAIQNILFTGSVSTAQQYYQYLTLALSTVWNSVRQIDMTRVVSQSITFSFDASRFVELYRTTSQQITMLLSVERMLESYRTVTQQILTSFNGLRLAEFFRNPTQTLTIILSSTRLIEVIRHATQSITLSTYSITEIFMFYYRTVVLTITTTISTSRLIDVTRSAVQTLTVSLNVQRLAEFSRDVAQSIMLAFQMGRTASFTRTIIQIFTTELSTSRLAELTRIASQTITMTLQATFEIAGWHFVNVALTITTTLAAQGEWLIHPDNYLTVETLFYFFFIMFIIVLALWLIERRD